VGKNRIPSEPERDAWGPLIVGPVTPAEFVAELGAARAELDGSHPVAEELAQLAERIEGALTRRHDVQSLLARARLRLGYAPEDHELLLAAGGATSIIEAATVLGIGVDAVHSMIRNGEVLAVRLFGEVLLPRFQFVAHGDRIVLLHGIAAVVAAGIKVAAEGWHIVQWLVLPSKTLGGRLPMEALRTGGVEAVIAAAETEI
jgi:hypothetical protein